MAFDVLTDKISVVTADFAEGFDQMRATIHANPNMLKMSGTKALQKVGLLPPDFVLDNYDVWDPAADRMTDSRFDGDYKRFFSFRDGAELAVQTLIDPEYAV